MRLNKIAFACGLLGFQAAAWAGTGEILQFQSASQIETLCEAKIAEAKKQAQAFSNAPSKQVLAQWDKLLINVRHISGPIGLASETHPNEAIRKAADACELKLSDFYTELYQNAAIYQSIQKVKAKDSIDQNAKIGILEDFESTGVNLAADKREQAKALMNRMDVLSQAYSKNLRDDNRQISFADAELVGVPSAFLQTKKRDTNGAYLIGFDYPEIDAVMQNAQSEDTRRRYALAYNQRGGDANLKLLDEMVALRLEYAQLLGFNNYADYALQYRMAKTAQNVNGFLDNIKAKVSEAELADLQRLSAEKQADVKDPNAKLNRWDISYYQNLIEKRDYAIDSEVFRTQFPVNGTVEWLFTAAQTLYGINIQANPNYPVWHESVKGFDVLEASNGQYIGTFYMDLFPREGKYKHAAAFPTRANSQQNQIDPISVLVTNFNPAGFNQDELETLFHEFGHVLHGVLSKARYSYIAGTSVKRDFVEAPSQMFEKWALNEETLKLFPKACPNCQPIDLKLIARVNEAKKFGMGFRYARQRQFAAFDMKLATDAPKDSLATWIALEQQTPLGYVQGYLFPASFGHIMGGYAAGYYGYLWSEVLAEDMASAFDGHWLDPKQGRRYRDLVLARGGEAEPADLVKAFLNRPADSSAFFKRLSTAQKQSDKAH